MTTNELNLQQEQSIPFKTSETFFVACGFLSRPSQIWGKFLHIHLGYLTAVAKFQAFNKIIINIFNVRRNVVNICF